MPPRQGGPQTQPAATLHSMQGQGIPAATRPTANHCAYVKTHADCCLLDVLLFCCCAAVARAPHKGCCLDHWHDHHWSGSPRLCCLVAPVQGPRQLDLEPTGAAAAARQLCSRRQRCSYPAHAAPGDAVLTLTATAVSRGPSTNSRSGGSGGPVRSRDCSCICIRGGAVTAAWVQHSATG